MGFLHYGFALGLVLAPWQVACQEPAHDSGISIPGLIERLGDRQFDVRSEATAALIQHGAEAVEPLAHAIDTTQDVEVQIRGLEILQAIASRDDDRVEQHVAAVVDRLLSNPRSSAARRARRLHWELQCIRHEKTVQRLRSLGAVLIPWDDDSLNMGDWRNRDPLAAALVDEAIGEFIHCIEFGAGWRGTIDDLVGLENIPEVTEVVIDRAEWTNTELQRVTTLPHVTRLVIAETQLDREGFALLARWDNLQRVSFLYCNGLKDDGFEAVATLPTLRWLAMLGTNVNAETVARIRRERAHLMVEHKPGAFLGVSSMAARSEQPGLSGVVMQTITEGGAAEKAGMIGGDTLLEFDGQAVNDFDTLRGLIADKRPQDGVLLKVRRGETELDIKVTLGKWKSSDWRQSGQPPPWEVMPMPIPIPAAPALR